jgi:hypothetical protein
MIQTTNNNAEDKANLLAGSVVVLYADDTVIVYAWRDEEGIVRDETAPAIIVESAVCRGKFAWADADAIAATAIAHALALPSVAEPQSVEWLGRKYLTGTINIEDVTPVDQSDLTNPSAIAARVPGMYQSLETLLDDYRNPQSEPMQEMFKGIRDRDEYERTAPKPTVEGL